GVGSFRAHRCYPRNVRLRRKAGLSADMAECPGSADCYRAGDARANGPAAVNLLSLRYRSMMKKGAELARDLRDASERFEHLHRHGQTKSIAARARHNPDRSPRISLVDAFPPARWRAFAL